MEGFRISVKRSMQWNELEISDTKLGNIHSDINVAIKTTDKMTT